MTKKEKLGDCYKANFDYVIDKMNNLPDVFICHGDVIGSPTSKIAGKQFDHCWIELGDILLDMSNGRNIVTRISNLESRIVRKTVTRYTLEEARKLVIKNEHYGPWTTK